jgi:hypothetical protein
VEKWRPRNDLVTKAEHDAEGAEFPRGYNSIGDHFLEADLWTASPQSVPADSFRVRQSVLETLESNLVSHRTMITPVRLFVVLGSESGGSALPADWTWDRSDSALQKTTSALILTVIVREE